MIEFIQSITDDELRFISELDYGNEAAKHLEALRAVIFDQGGVITVEQQWYPYELIELGSNWLQEHHEREFSICTLLVVLNAKAGTDLASDLQYKLVTHSSEYGSLPKEQQELVLKAYQDAGC